MANPLSIQANWPAVDNVYAFTTTRIGVSDGLGTSTGVHANFNLAEHVNDQPSAVSLNRQFLSDEFKLPSEPVWLKQTHSNRVIKVDSTNARAASPGEIEADASWTSKANIVCAVLTADCLPVLFTNSVGSCVAIAHAGWRGMLDGVISSTFYASDIQADDCLVWLGPAISQDFFEVGDDVKQAFMAKDRHCLSAFTKKDAHHWMCDLYQLARNELKKIGIHKVYGGDLCTYSDRERFYSYRRDGETGRMASLIWIGD